MATGLVEPLVARAVAGLVWLLTGATARWRGVAPDGRQRVYFANHASHLDFVVLWSALPPAVRRATRPVAGARLLGRGTACAAGWRVGSSAPC